MPGLGEELVATSYRRVSVWRGVSFCDIITALSPTHTRFLLVSQAYFYPKQPQKGPFVVCLFCFPLYLGSSGAGLESRGEGICG